MTWAPLQIRAPLGGADSILAGMPQSLGVINIDPWQYGVGEGTGAQRWLSFPNAVSAAIRRLPSGFDGAVLAVGVAARSLSELRGGLDGIAAAFPMPMFGKIARRAASLQTLEIDKWALPEALPPGVGTALTGGLPSMAELKAAALRQASAAAIELLGDPLALLDDLDGEMAGFQAGLAAALDHATAGLSGTPPGCWRCYATADHAAALLADAPGHEHTQSTVSVFLGSPADLSIISEVLGAVA